MIGLLLLGCPGVEPEDELPRETEEVVDTEDTEDTEDTGTPPGPKPWECEALPLPSTVTELSPGDDLQAAVDAAQVGDTLLLSAGTYSVDGRLWIRSPGITLRGVGRDEVILDASRQGGSVVTVAASDVTVAHMTLKNAWTHGVHVRPEAQALSGVHLYDLHVWNPGEQAIKINQQDDLYVDDGEVACSRMTLDDEGRPEIRNNCYTGGIDAHRTRGWTFRDNTIEGFWCPSGLAEHGIHLWRQNADSVIERNVLINVTRGIGLGMAATSGGNERDQDATGCPEVDYIDDFRGQVVNNTVYADDPGLFASSAGFDTGIAVWNACEATVAHNTVYSTSPPYSSIEWRFSGTTVLVQNNLVSHPMKDRGVTSVLSEGNLETAHAGDFAALPDLHLAAGSQAIDAGVPGETPGDIDGELRDSAPDVGADEL